MQASMLAPLGRLLLEGAPIAEANRAWLQRRCEAGDWIESDEVRLREMLSPSLRWLLRKDRG